MSDLTWTRDDHVWLSRRNRSALCVSVAGCEELRKFYDLEANRGGPAPLLMHGRKRNVNGEDGAEQYNAVELRRLAARTGRAIVVIGACHDRPKGAPNLKPDATTSRMNKDPISFAHASHHFQHHPCR